MKALRRLRIWARHAIQHMLQVKHIHGIADIRHYDARGHLLRVEHLHNIWHDEGEEYLIKAAFTEETTVPVSFYLGLDARPALAEDDALADLVSEPSGSGYARVGIASDGTDWTSQQDGGTSDWECVSKTATFTASGGDWAAQLNIFLATTTDNSGKLLSSMALSASRTILDGESLACTYTVRID